jgi:uncharacterized protein YprB with RNaseH-like and TPR domain
MKADINSVICFGWKIIGGQSGVVSSWELGSNIHDDAAVCAFAYDLLHDADAVVTHNGRRFDWKFLQTRLTINGLPNLPKIPHMDTCYLARGHYSLFSNRLKDLAALLTPERKIDTGGSDLWTRVYKGDVQAQKEMAEYCHQDVIATEAVFDKLKHLATNYPNRNLYSGEGGCPTCGSAKLEKHGTRATKTKLIQRYRCRSCGSTCSDSPLNRTLRSVS